MLTHMEERPEKCPIETCEYHTKGFARKYDKNRHALTHYKGTMVCPFCPGAGTAYEKAFNRADVFKRHLTAVHNVEQTPPNQRKTVVVTGPGGTIAAKAGGTGADVAPEGKNGARCSICHAQFATAQEFYEHLDDCVLSVVVPGTPRSEATRKDSTARGRTPTTTEKGKGSDARADDGGDGDRSERDRERERERGLSSVSREEEGRRPQEGEADREEDEDMEKHPVSKVLADTGSEGSEGARSESRPRTRDPSPPGRSPSAAALVSDRSPDNMEVDTTDAANPSYVQRAEVSLGSPASGEDKMDTEP
jgi:hypothetical protein